MARAPAKNPALGGGAFGELPKFSHGNVLAEIGSSGLRSFGGYVREEFISNLIGRQAATVYREMLDNSPIIGGLIFAIEGAMRKVEWRVEPGNTKATDKEVEFVESLRVDMEHSWEDFVIEALSMIGYGYCLPPDQLVMRADGTMVPASDVRLGDKLMTKEGRGRPVLHIFNRHHSGDMVSIRVRGYPHPIRLTPNHRVPTQSGWKNAGDLTQGDVLLRPRPQLEAGGDYLSGWLIGLYLAEGSRDKDRTRVTFSLHDNEVDEVGARVSEWISAKGLTSHHHLSKCEPSLYRALSGNDNSGRVTFSHPEFRSFIDEWVAGDTSWDKALTKLPVDEEFAKGLFEGWIFGDGCRWKNTGWDSVGAQGFTVSRDLAHQMQAIAGAIGLPSPMFYRLGGAPGINGGITPAAYVLSAVPQRKVVYKRTDAAEEEVHALRASGMAMQSIAAQVGLSYTTVFRWVHSDGPKPHGLQCEVFQKTVGHDVLSVSPEPYDGEVIDFEIEEDHTFCAGPIAVSNSIHELVYKRRNGPRAFGSKVASSKYNDGLIGWRKLPVRSQDTILKWFFDENGVILGVTQQPWLGSIIDVPAEKFILFRPKQHKNNPEGRSVLRNSYVPYYYVKRLQELEAIRIERMAGNVLVRVPNQLLDAAAAGDAGAVSTLRAYQKMATRAKTDEQMGLVLPSDVYPSADGKLTNARMFDYEYLTPQGAQSVDANVPIVRHKLDMLTSTLTDFIQMGHSNRGAQNLADTKVDLFLSAVEGWLNSMAGVINNDALPRLWALNGFDHERMPLIVPDMAQQVNLDALGSFILSLSQSGVQMFPDEDLEAYVRDAAGLPDAVDGRPWASKLIEDAGGETPKGKPDKPKSTAKALVDGFMANELRTRKRLA